PAFLPRRRPANLRARGSEAQYCQISLCVGTGVMPGQLAPGLIAVDGNHELAIDLQYAEVLRMHKARSKVVGAKLKTQAALLDPFEPIPCDPCHQRPKLTSPDLDRQKSSKGWTERRP